MLCDGETSFVEQQFMALDDSILWFGGWIAMTDDDTGRAYLGVWGKRNAKRFRRMLRERGALFMLVRGDQPGRRRLRSETRESVTDGGTRMRSPTGTRRYHNLVSARIGAVEAAWRTASAVAAK